MKPRNRFEKAVLAESKYLRPITKTQSKWAFRECIGHFAYRLPKGRTTCMDCGHSWLMEKPAQTCTCPHCGARLQVEETYGRKLKHVRCQIKVHNCKCSYLCCNFILLFSEILLLIEFCFIVSLFP